MLLPYANEVLGILQNITSREDGSLKLKDTNTDNDKYYQRAINSMHGEAFAGIVEYGLWLGKNDQKSKAESDITPILDKLLSSPYLETWSVFGRYLPWLGLISPKWTKDNLDNIFPEDGSEKFDAAWLSYINFVQPFNDVLKLLKRKYLYVLKNHLYAKEKAGSTDRKLGQHIVIYYARNEIDIDDDVMKALFEIPENEWERASLFYRKNFTAARGY